MVLFPPAGLFTTCWAPLGKLGDKGFVKVKEIKLSFFGGLISDWDLMNALNGVIGMVVDAVPIKWLSAAVAIGKPLALNYLLDFKIGREPAEPKKGDTQDDIIRVTNGFDWTEKTFLKGMVYAKGSGISSVQATLDLEDYCLGKASDSMFVIVLPDLEQVDIRNQAGRPEDPLVVDIAESIQPHGVGMFNAFKQGSVPMSVGFDPIGETNREKITEMAENMIPGAKKWLNDLGVPVTVARPSGATLNQAGVYEGGDYYFKMKLAWQPLAATFTIDELRLQAPLWHGFTKWALKPTPNPFATVEPDYGTVTGVQSGMTDLRLDVCIPVMTKRADENRLLVRGASIRGHKFLDKNMNGKSDDGEPGIPGFVIELNGSEQRITYKDGTYFFNDLAPGTYTVREIQQPGYEATTPTSVQVKVEKREIHNIHFGNRLLTGEIQVFKFNDLNRNAQYDWGEPFVENWEIKLVNPARTATTNGAGWVSFGNLPPGQYTVQEVMQPGWYNTTPISQTVTASAGNVTFVYFGNSPIGPDRSVIYGSKFEDLDGNGKWDTGEPFIPQWPIMLSGAATANTTTDEKGEYEFKNLEPKTYQVNEAMSGGWTRTTALLPSISLMAGMQVEQNFGNFRHMQVRGRKFKDPNGNGVQDQGEPGLPGWTIQLDLQADGQVDYVAVTDGNGDYRIDDVGPGDYQGSRTFTIREVPQPGWEQTWPKATEIYPIHSGLVVSNANFGNRPLVKLTAIKIEDLDGDGEPDAGEPGYAGWRMFLDLKNDGTNDKEATTDATGRAYFDNVPPGTHALLEESRAGWIRTYPADGRHLVRVEADGIAPAPGNFVNFHLVKLCGVKFEDKNGTGKREEDEPGLPDWTIQLDLNNDGGIDKTAVTGAFGNYCFEDIGPGTHKIKEVLRTGWIRTIPASPGEHVVKVKSSEDKTGLDFGNFRLGAISGRKFNDLNKNGSKDKDEPGLQGWVIYRDHNFDGVLNNPKGNGICDPGATELCAVTDKNGDYGLPSLTAGIYRIREVPQSGWKQSTKDPDDLPVKSGQAYTDIDFGNVPESGGAEIRGLKFYDFDHDGVKDAHEPGIPGWTIFLDANSNGQLDSGEKTAVSDEDGKYALTEMTPGSYTLREVQKPGWRQTVPTSGTYSVTITTGQKVTDRDFGNYILFPSYLYFPFYQGNAQAFTGFALSNYSSQPLIAVFNAYGKDGQRLNFPRNPAVFRLNANGQLARLGNELFRVPGDGEQSGWIEVLCDSGQVGSFFQFAGSSLKKIDGSVAFTQMAKKLYFTRVLDGPGYHTRLSIANPTDEQIKLDLRLVKTLEGWPTSVNGSMNGSSPQATPLVSRTIPAKGLLYDTVADLFETEVMFGGYVVAEVTQGTGAVGFELLEQDQPETVIGLNAHFENFSTKAYCAQLASGPTVMTLLKFTNVSNQTRLISLTAFNEEGKNIGQSTFSLAPGEQYEDEAGYIFNLDFNSLTVGSVSVTSDGPGVLSDVVFGEPNSFEYLAALPLQTSGFGEAIFSHVANGVGFFTGIGIFNPNPQAAEVTIQVFSPEGVETGQQHFTVAAGNRFSKLLPELVPSTNGQLGGYVVIRSTQPLVAQQLFGGLSLTLMSAVPPTIVR
ncbi:MAG: hypothetical protein EHM61_23465 [Acidobacteria bacterium]|nr:MAG: hypothetical protein EHM61_23465 [Acidobacteriota bacterium]